MGHGDSDHQQEPLPLRGREGKGRVCRNELQRGASLQGEGGSQILGPQGYNTLQGAQSIRSTMCCTHPLPQAPPSQQLVHSHTPRHTQPGVGMLP